MAAIPKNDAKNRNQAEIVCTKRTGSFTAKLHLETTTVVLDRQPTLPNEEVLQSICANAISHDVDVATKPAAT